ncbi:MAG: CDP-diacylglycerol--serine O-phosphatidyltransferase [Bacteroidales bacterium]|nr:CDP-diacylglycerol--serine O-phosphatidyltransferase [Bacteroidales bacterium]
MNIVKHIPNAITSMNLLCGVLGVICTFQGQFDIAFYLMLAAAVCDFCDGLSARLLNAYSSLGKELDSLADMVSFGVLPSLMTYKLMTELHGDSLLCLTPLLIAVFSALRLAKFNIDERQSDNFIGLATPACAMICGSFVYYVSNDPTSVLYNWAASRFFIPAISVFLSLLLISEIPMFSMKFKKNIKAGTPIHKQRVGFAGVIFVAVLLTILLGLNWSFIILLTFVSYIIMNIGIALLFKRQ